MQTEALIDELTTLGLDEDEAEVYLRLLQLGPSKVSDLSATVQLGRTKLYRLLDRLAQKGVVTKGLERPTIYDAEPPDEVFDASIQELERKRSAIEHAREAIEETLGELQADPIEPTVYAWRVVESRREIGRTLETVVEDAEERIDIVWNQHVQPGEPDRIEDAWKRLRTRADEGLDVRALVTPVGAVDALFPGEGYGQMAVRRLDAEAELNFALADGEELLTWVRWRPQDPIDGEDVALHTDTPGLTSVHRHLFEELWRQAGPADASG